MCETCVLQMFYTCISGIWITCTMHLSLICSPGPNKCLCLGACPETTEPRFYYFSNRAAMFEKCLRFMIYLEYWTPTWVWSAVQGSLWCCVCFTDSYSTLLNWPIVSLLILFILLSMFFVLIHDYTMYFTGSQCYNYSNYISIWPYYTFNTCVSHMYNTCRTFW